MASTPSWSVDSVPVAPDSPAPPPPRPAGTDDSNPSWSAHMDALIQSRITPAAAPQSIVLDDSDMGYIKIPVRVATLGDFTPTGAATIQGVTLVNGDRVLIGFGATNPVASQYGGVWLVNTGGAWTRAVDALTWDLLLPGTIVAVREGDYHGQLFVHITDPGNWNSGSLGSTPQLWSTDVDSGQFASVANGAALSALDITAIPEGTSIYVLTYKARFTLDKTTTRTADPDRVLASPSPTSWWIRSEGSGDPFWQSQAAWYIDPSVLHGGSDENDGLTSGTPIKSIAEWRRRVKGARYTSDVVIRVLSASTNSDDGLFYGFTTTDQALTKVVLLGVPTLVFSGTITAYQAYSGNTRGSITDASIPVSWTTSGGVSSSSGSRFVRKVGSGIRHYACLAKDLGANTVQMGVVVDWNDQDTATLATAETNFTVGDQYEVVSMTQWPAIQSIGCFIRTQCLDLYSFQNPDFTKEMNTDGGRTTSVLCGFPSQVASFESGAGWSNYSCIICPSVGFQWQGGQYVSFNTTYMNVTIEPSLVGFSWNGQINVFINTNFTVWHSNVVGSFGILRFYDCSFPLLSVRHTSYVRLNGAVVGSGNTGYLVQCDTTGVLYGAANITATTSSPHKYLISGNNYDAPTVDMSTGDAVYN